MGPEDIVSEIEELIVKHSLSKDNLKHVLDKGIDFADYFEYYFDNYPLDTEWDNIIDIICRSNSSQLKKTDPEYKSLVKKLSSKYILNRPKPIIGW